MNIIAKYKEFEKTLENVVTYKDLRKQIRQSFKFILKNNFTIYYLDEDNDKITISNQEDLDVVQNTENFEIMVEEIDDASELTDDSFQKLDKSVKETVNYFRKLSNGHGNNDSNSPKIIQKQEMEQAKEIVEKPNNPQEILDQKRQKAIKEITATIEHLRAEILKVENDDTEKRLNEKIEKLQKPQVNPSSLGKELIELPIIQQIEQAENNIINLNKVEREELKRNYQNLLKQIQLMIQNRQKNQVNQIAQTKDVIKTEQKLKQLIVKTNQKNQKLLKQYKGLLSQYQKKLKEVENKKANFEKVEYMTKDQLEDFLDKQMKEELKAKKEKQEALKQKEQIINIDNPKKEQENQNLSDNIQDDLE
ncbi:unnamed protein product (macronuclear) [Paramecium tetraurelia]|uniref:PB1 domain-containing protein n=1 Tax=Paramecium tetraurelia TaxID=5888 RepID=A0C582_PARTE|nr:uncharacterized protein GSPATT00006448001 [Paramecium tetraurelia]CAK65949.1 unnamed protein product [Paramecium tetraurelia]|eukprot:XP_001433346.1 hypothetical protein (macronuclear) [Paramecium tetraurelia strain d4-2]